MVRETASLSTRKIAKEPLVLVRPAEQHLHSYMQALQQGWSPDNLRPEAAQEHLARIAVDPQKFLAEQDDREAKGPPVILPDGTQVPRLPGYARWMWDGEFCGSIGFRWQPGSADLPPYCLGHIGYSVVAAKRNRGYARRALQLLLRETKLIGLPYVELVTDDDNLASQKVIEANGGVLVERFHKLPEHGGKKSLRYRIYHDALNRAIP